LSLQRAESHESSRMIGDPLLELANKEAEIPMLPPEQIPQSDIAFARSPANDSLAFATARPAANDDAGIGGLQNYDECLSCQ
jgi:hypothetical protein